MMGPVVPKSAFLSAVEPLPEVLAESPVVGEYSAGVMQLVRGGHEAHGIWSA
jgi:hypothetical protein